MKRECKSIRDNNKLYHLLPLLKTILLLRKVCLCKRQTMLVVVLFIEQGVLVRNSCRWIWLIYVFLTAESSAKKCYLEYVLEKGPKINPQFILR